MSNKRKKGGIEFKFGYITKKLQCKLQSTIIFVCFNSNKVLRAGKSASKKTLI